MLLWVLACTNEGSVTVDGVATTPSGSTGDTATPGVTGETGAVPLVPLIDEALSGRCPDPAPRSVFPDGDALHRATVLGSDAKCNDGTPPVLYVRTATDPAHAADWVLHLEGGAFCADYEECAVRWCGEDFYDASKMSSRWAPERRNGGGIVSRDPSNAFAGWNHAYFYYCSSDLYVGAREDHVFEGDPPYRVHWDGHDIVMASLDALSAGVTSDDGVEALGSLDAATTVLFTGSSAGAYGATTFGQLVADRLPGAQVIVAPDSMFFAAPEVLTPTEQQAVDALMSDYHSLTFGAVWGAWMREDCLADHAADPQTCTSVSEILRRYTTAPTLWHVDLYDRVLWDSVGSVMSLDRFAEVVDATLRLVAAERPDASLHGSACGGHVTLTGDAQFSGLTVEDDLGAPWSVHDQLVALLSGQAPDAIDDPSGDGSVCPGPPGPR